MLLIVILCMKVYAIAKWWWDSFFIWLWDTLQSPLSIDCWLNIDTLRYNKKLFHKNGNQPTSSIFLVSFTLPSTLIPTCFLWSNLYPVTNSIIKHKSLLKSILLINNCNLFHRNFYLSQKGKNFRNKINCFLKKLPNSKKNNKANRKINPLKNHLISPLTNLSTNRISIKLSIQLNLIFLKKFPIQEKDPFLNSSIQIFRRLKRLHKKIVSIPQQWTKLKPLNRLHNKLKKLRGKEVILKTV